MKDANAKLFEVRERAFRIAVVREQRMAELQFRKSRRLVVLFEPRFEKRFGFVELLDIEQVQTVVKIIIFRAGNQRLQGFGTILRERKFFGEADLLPARNHGHDGHSENGTDRTHHDEPRTQTGEGGGEDWE